MHLIQPRAWTARRSSRSASPLRARLLSAEKTVNYPQSTTLIFSQRFNQFEVEILHHSPGSLSASRLLGWSLFGCSSVTAPLFPLYSIYRGLCRHRCLTQRSPPCLLDIQQPLLPVLFCPKAESPCKSCCLPHRCTGESHSGDMALHGHSQAGDPRPQGCISLGPELKRGGFLSKVLVKSRLVWRCNHIFALFPALPSHQQRGRAVRLGSHSRSAAALGPYPG